MTTKTKTKQLVIIANSAVQQTQMNKHPCCHEPTREELDGTQLTFQPREEVRGNKEQEKMEEN